MKSLRVAIIADDLTGALDVCAPFARRGLNCRVAVSPVGLVDVLDHGADVICVNTASRELNVEAATRVVREVAENLAAWRPQIVFKKIDSRLKGHVAAEIGACQAALGHSQTLVAPAIPTQERFLQGGMIVGKGVPDPIDVASKLGIDAIIGDGTTDLDMELLARQHMDDALLVGASGLGEGLAAVLSPTRPAPLLSATLPLLFAIGSHDPATQLQIERLSDIADQIVSLDGEVPSTSTAERTLIRASSNPDDPQHGAVLSRFGRSIADQLRSGRFTSALLCGGETAQTVLNELGVRSLELVGEVLPGIALSRVALGEQTLTILTKSGGFGTPDDLFHIAQGAQRASPGIDPNRAGIPA